MASFEDIDKARRLLGLGEFASLKDTRRAYRKKAMLYHPDKSDGQNAQGEETMSTRSRRRTSAELIPMMPT